ncbi:histidine phosphatase family protein [Lacisediminihabitans changchengi]|uniref:Histidine phosphatase family protein n=1 Tax=Lacisediminihabitans changchengi TaxID=2787634 RepID=A0A934SJW8_9MICO|nr:histidine phosphatase family protein [Lacisediminihabitans changchengi]MBK4346886.1 histidine phosphatase family protein [Lacisediminihabitans changchengi]MBK4347991.1 histidine phosphatase family protein [Lacisediminihabitans changchengi]
MTLLYLVRHGQTDWNLQRRIQGSTDIPLNDTGRDQARRAGRLLARRHWDVLASSPLSRAYETAEIIGAEIGLGSFGPAEIEIEPDLVERAYGDAEGLSGEELDRRFPDDTPVPGRERRTDVAARAIAALVTLGERHPGAGIVVVTHGGVIRSVMNAVAPGALAHSGVPISNGSIHSFEIVAGTPRLIAFDDPIEWDSVDVHLTVDLDGDSNGRADDVAEQNAAER